jgi:hypothetical protein
MLSLRDPVIHGSQLGDGLTLGSSGALHLAAVRLWGSRVVREWPGSAGSDGASPYLRSSLHSSESERIILPYWTRLQTFAHPPT